MIHEFRPLQIAIVFSLSIGVASAQLAKPPIALHAALVASPAAAQQEGGTAGTLSVEMLTAARNGDVAAVKQLLAKGEDVNAANPDGVTALMIAGAEDHLNVVLVLLEAGADARLKTASGKTAAVFATGRGYAEVAAVLNDAASKPPVAPAAKPAPAQTPPPADPANGNASLEATMQFIQEQLNGNTTSFTLYIHNNISGADQRIEIRFQYADFVADPVACRITGLSNFSASHQVPSQLQRRHQVNLREVQSISVIPWAEAVVKDNSLTERTDPPVFVLVVRFSNNEEKFTFPDKSKADAVAKATNRAVDLCRGRN